MIPYNPLSLPPWITVPRLAMAGLFVVIALLVWPKSDHSDTTVEDNGYRVAKRLPSLRRENAERLRELEAAKLRTDERFAAAKRNLSKNAPRFDTLPVRVDSAPRPVIGDVQEGDTLIALRVVRRDVSVFIDSTLVALGEWQGAVMLERGRASLAIASLERTVAAQDTVIQGLRLTLNRARKPWYKRAAHGVQDAAAGVACGSLGYLAFGPLPAVGLGVACAAISGMR